MVTSNRKITPIAINWHGPFASLRAANQAASDGKVEEGIYLAVDKANRAYTGISKRLPARLIEPHHVLSAFVLGPDQAEIWVGVLASPNVWTRSDALHSTAIKLAERMTVFFLMTENINLTTSLPDRSVSLLNRWYDGYRHADRTYKRKRQRGHRNWPDLIEFDFDNKTARSVWFGGRQKWWPADPT